VDIVVWLRDSDAGLLPLDPQRSTARILEPATTSHPRTTTTRNSTLIRRWGKTTSNSRLVTKSLTTTRSFPQFRHYSSIDDVKNARQIYKNITLLHCSPPSCASAAAIVICSEDYVKATVSKPRPSRSLPSPWPPTLAGRSLLVGSPTFDSCHLESYNPTFWAPGEAHVSEGSTSSECDRPLSLRTSTLPRTRNGKPLAEPPQISQIALIV